MQKGLVSIITPCYNTGAIVHRLLDSILMQDYPSIEMFYINDGSTDNTEEVVKSYIPKFEAKGCKLTYIYQENSGQSVAVNRGLKLVDGEFLMWPDSDDYFIDPSIISKLVVKMKSGNYSMGRCRIQYVDDSGNIRDKGTISSLLQEENQFDNFITGRNGIAFPPVAYIVSMQVLDEVIPNREIYTEKRAGQNWQIMMPLSYKHKVFYLSDIGANVLERAESHSRGQFEGYEKTLEKMKVYERTITNTLNRMIYMDNGDFVHYMDDICTACAHNRMVLNILNYKTKLAFHEYNHLGRKKRLLFYFACCLSLNKYTFFLMRLYLRLTKSSL